MKTRKSNRLRVYDYSNAWWYFVTICTHEHENRFGGIIDGKVILNDVGKIAIEKWDEIPLHYPAVELDKFVIMPNHIHGIIIINENIVGNEYLRSN